MSTLSTADKIRLIHRMCSYIPHAHLQGIRFEQLEGDELTLRLPYRQELVGNPDTGVIHSGVLTVLLDQTLGIAGICCNDVGALITPTLDLRMDHLGIAPAGRDILACARVYKATSRILFVSGFAYCDSRHAPIARATGSWIIKRELNLHELFAEAGEQAGRKELRT